MLQARNKLLSGTLEAFKIKVGVKRGVKFNFTRLKISLFVMLCYLILQEMRYEKFMTESLKILKFRSKLIL